MTGQLSSNLTLEGFLAIKEALRTPPSFEIWVASYGPEGMNFLSLPAVSDLGDDIEYRYSHSLVERVVIMRQPVLGVLLADGEALEGIPIYYLDVEEREE